MSLRTCCILIALAAAPAANADVIGRVLIAVGEVSATRGAQAVNLGTGAAIEGGDTIVVGPSSNAQIRFNDESVVALRPQTVFRIEEYNYAGRQDGLEKSVFNLVQGGMRTVTGLIGKLNRANYQVRTPTSTVGIRGTNYNLVHCDAGCLNKDGSPAPRGTYGGVFDGRIGVGNQTGERTFGSDEYFYVASASAPPQALVAPPAFLQDRLEGTTRRGNQKSSESTETMAQSGASADGRVQTVAAPEPKQEFVSTEQKNTSGGSAVITLATGFIAQYSNGTNFYVINDCPDAFCTGPALNAKQFSASNGILTGYSGTGFSGALAGGTVVDTGTVTIAGIQFGWGRWVGNFTVTDADGTFSGATAKSGVLFGLTNDPSVNNNQALPTSGTVNYVQAGGPLPVDTAGTTATSSTISGSVNFTTRAVNMNLNLSLTTNLGVASITASGSGTIPANNNDLLGATLTASCVGAGCGAGTSGNFDARFAAGAKAMALNGGITNIVRYTGPIDRSVLFLNILKCNPGC